ncbi:MAG: endonuclease/exonuclease/phosphatase family protein [Actinobacteria bacterium]|nr:endonuclease/exonuclease/phosphatase family protein [Actinomycetota bacterium]
MADGPVPAGHLRFVTLNLWGRAGDWPARRAAVLAGLRALAPDVVGLQEVEELEGPDGTVENQAAGLAAELGLHVVYGVSHTRELPDGVTRRFGNALLSRYPLSGSGCRPLPEGRRDEPRSLLHAVVGTPHGPMTVVVTHLAWRLDASADRVRQVVALAACVENLHPSPPDDDDPGWLDLPPVVLADLNAEPASDEVRFLTGLSAVDGLGVRYADAWRYGGDGEGCTYAPSNPFAARSSEHGRRIDYVLVRGPVDGGLGVPHGPRLAFTEPVGGVHASDHYGVVADLRVVPVGQEG